MLNRTRSSSIVCSRFPSSFPQGLDRSILTELDEIKENYFAALAVGIKLQGELTRAWKTRDVDIPQLYHQTILSHPDWSTWPDLLRSFLIKQHSEIGTMRCGGRWWEYESNFFSISFNSFLFSNNLINKFSCSANIFFILINN